STIVVVTADHGEEFQEHGKLTHGPDLYDELLHVPLVVVGPGVSPGRVREQVQGIDVFPTVAALLGVQAPAGLPGIDLMARREPRPAYSETSLGIVDGKSGKLVSLRTPEWKLIQTPATGRFELYDLAHDAGEHEDRFGTAPEGASGALTLLLLEVALRVVDTVTSEDLFDVASRGDTVLPERADLGLADLVRISHRPDLIYELRPGVHGRFVKAQVAINEQG